MALYRIRFELCSPIVTPLKGDTIWGHIVWGIANRESSAAVTDFLEQERAEPPALVVSSAFPAGMLCRPMPLPVDRDGGLKIDDYSKIKKAKKIKYVPASNYFDESETADNDGEDPLKKVKVMHNTIDRAVNSVLEGGLYSVEEMWAKIPAWDLYIQSSFDSARIKELVGWAFENGYGADASTGKGKVAIKGDPVLVETKKQEGDYYMALGPFVGSNKNITNLRADIFVRAGKLGGAFAASMSPWKKPVVLYDEGAVFKCGSNNGYVGTLLEDMHADNKSICQSGFAPVIPVDYKE